MSKSWQGYFGSDYVHDVEIGLYELWGYANAQKRYEKLIADYDDVIELIYDSNISPGVMCIDYELGRIYAAGSSAETQALRIIDEKEVYHAKIEKEKRKSDMFFAAIKKLDELEQILIRIIYLGERDCTDLSSSTFYTVLTTAEEKLVEHLQKVRSEQFKEISRKKREALRLLTTSKTNTVMSQPGGSK
jgi:tetratricopeptide (TPR) repeat protein